MGIPIRSFYSKWGKLLSKSRGVSNIRSDLPIVPQFGKQEPASDEKIAEFVKKYNFQGELFQKIEVNGKNAHRKRQAENVCFLKSN